MYTLPGTMKEFNTMKKQRTRKMTLLLIFISLIVIYLQHFQLNYSASIPLMTNLRISPLYQLLGMMIVSLPFLFFLLLSGNSIISLLCSSVFMTALSIANYFTYLYHGSPAMAGDLYSFGTAMNVISEYSFSPDGFVLRLIAILIAELTLIAAAFFLLRKSDKMIRRSVSCAAIVISCLTLWLAFFSPWTLFPENLVTFSWTQSVQEYGYETCFANSVYSLANKFVIPDGYSADRINVHEGNQNSIRSEDYPDIILILNETLCDLNYCIDLPEGKEVLKAIDEIPGVISGYSVASLVGGGTNNSEYELLTSNSMSLFAVSAPFQIMDLSDSNSIVTYLEDLGYYTAAMHCGQATNYARSRAYVQMGFDDAYLGPENFTKNYYGNRPWLDMDNYSDLIRYYEAAPDQPRLMYLLSFQNHGGYEQNEPDMDQVSVSKDFGEYTDDVNEFLTSVQMSAEAFRGLCEAYKNAERPVIILMVGDHAPSFISSLPYRETFNDVEKNIADRVIPYYVWSNMNLDASQFSEYSSMIDLVPMMLNAAGMPMSQYYSDIVRLNRKIPVRTSDNRYMDANGQTGVISDELEDMNLIRNYWYMEYNSLMKGKDYQKELFEAQ